MIMAKKVSCEVLPPIPITKEQVRRRKNPISVYFRMMETSKMQMRATLTIRLPQRISETYLNLLLMEW